MSLPPLYAKWAVDLLEGATIPEETRSDCGNCPMASHDPNRNRSQFVFLSETKCCTYWPDLPNFLVGNILNDQSPDFAEMRFKFRHLMQEGMLISPLGAYPPPGYWEVYKKLIFSFGHNPSLLCPYFRKGDGGCGIWKHRTARCATWFCQYERGGEGVLFWKQTDRLFSEVESILTKHCIHTLIDDPKSLAALFPAPPASRELSQLGVMWGKWNEKREEFFLECGRLAQSLRWSDVMNIGGESLQNLSQQTKHAYREMTRDRAPREVTVGTWRKVRPLSTSNIRIWSYSQYDPIDLTSQQFERLREIKKPLRADDLLKDDLFSAGFIRKLLDFGVLSEATQEH